MIIMSIWMIIMMIVSVWMSGYWAYEWGEIWIDGAFVDGSVVTL